MLVTDAGQILGETAVEDASLWNGGLNGLVYPGDGLNIKSSQGAFGQDPWFEFNAEECLLYGKPIGAYHFLDGDNYRSEAKNWYDTVRLTVGLDYVKLGLWADIEKVIRSLSVWQYESYASAFLLESEQLFGRWIGIYTSPGFWNSYIARNNWAKNYYLWNAQWPYHPEYKQVPPATQLPIIPHDWNLTGARKKCILWQYEGDGNYKALAYGFPGRPYTQALDFGRFLFDGRMGTMQEFINFFDLEGGVPPQPPPFPPEPEPDPEPPIVTPCPEKVRITAGGNLRLRNKASAATGVVVGWAKDRTVWYPEGVTVDELGRYWYWVNGQKVCFAEWLTKPIEE